MSSTKRALEKYIERQAAKEARERGPKRKNQKPEHELKLVVLKWLRENDFSVDSVESKAVYSEHAGRYLSGQTVAGMPDVVGSTPDGLGAFIELKAPGRRSTLRDAQRTFLTEKINRFAFAVCIDSVESLAEVWSEFQRRRAMSPQLGRALLLRHLPPERVKNDSESLFDE